MGAFPASFLAKYGTQFFKTSIHGTDTQLTRTTAFPHGVADIIVRAVDFVDASGDVTAAGGICAKAPNIHFPQIQAGFTVNNPLCNHLANTTCAGNSMRTEAAGSPEAFYIR